MMQVSAMPEAWFEPKKFGYGATPKNWKGWVASTAFALVLCATAAAFVMLTRSGTGPIYLGAWLAVMAAVTGGFVWLARVKTDGEWRWRWRRRLLGPSPFAGER
jgi:hypothetical protein